MRVGLLLVLVSACTPQAATPPPLEDLQLPGGERFTLHPPVVGQGTSVRLELQSLRSSLRFEGTALTLQEEGLTLDSFAVLDGFTGSAELQVETDAPLGALDVLLSIGTNDYLLEDGLTIIDQRLGLAPGEARMGEVVEVTLTGHNTSWGETTWARFGPDVQTLDVTVLDPTQLVARIAVASDALPGFRDVTVEHQGAALTAYDGFVVDRAVLTASFDPPVVAQGDEVDVVIEGVNTRFREGFVAEQVQFWRQTAPIADFTFVSFEQQSDTRLVGRMKVSNAAQPGPRDVFLDDEEDLLIQDAFTVTEVAPDPMDARMVKALDVRRTLQSDGTISDNVRAYAWFVIPLDPPCGPPFIPAQGPVPFDIDGVFPNPPPVEAIDCPEPLTIDAGDFVFFESPTNTITLHKELNGSTEQILYRGRDLTLADYQFGQIYDIRVSGNPDGIPAFTVEDAQPTVPEDYQILTPSFDTLVHDRFTPFPLTWTSAGVYPTGLFSLSISGTLDVDGLGGNVSVLPFDDGSFTFGANKMNQLRAGDAQFTAVSGVEGRIWQLPFNGRNHQGDSTLVTRGVLELQ